MGKSRSATLVLIYLVKHCGMTLREAFLMLKAKRPIVEPNIGFWRQMINFEEKLIGRASVKIVDSIENQTENIPDVYLDLPHKYYLYP